jgi:hypothetical protein
LENNSMEAIWKNGTESLLPNRCTMTRVRGWMGGIPVHNGKLVTKSFA